MRKKRIKSTQKHAKNTRKTAFFCIEIDIVRQDSTPDTLSITRKNRIKNKKNYVKKHKINAKKGEKIVFFYAVFI